MNAEKQNKNLSVFLIDDDDLLLEMYALKFRTSGFGVEIAKSGEEALEKLRAGLNPNLILLDLVMPQMDGFEILKTIKAEKLAPDSKIIVLSNLGQKEDIEKGTALGASAYLIKANLTPSEVVKSTEVLLSKYK